MSTLTDADVALINPGRKPPWGRAWLRSGALDEIPGLTPKGISILTYDEMAQKRLTSVSLPRAHIVYALTGLTPSRPRSYELAEMIHARGGLIVAGGMDVTGHFSEGFESELLDHYDAIVPGRLTHALWEQILSDASRKSLQRIYIADPSDPWEFAIPCHNPNPKLYFMPACSRSSYGCTEKCPFCTVHLVGGLATVHTKPLDILEAELKVLQGARIVVDASDSFGCDYDHTIKVLELYRKYNIRWVTEITVKNLMGYNGHPPLLWEMARSGCVGIYIGIENIDHAVSGKSLEIKQVENAILEAHRAELMVLGSVVLDAFDSDDEIYIRKVVAWIIEQRLEFAQYSLVAALPGSQLRRIALSKGQIIDNNPEHLDGAWPTIWRPLSARKRIELLAWAYQETYSRNNIQQRLRHLSGWKQHSIASAGNWQIHFTAKGWRRRFNYPHWFATRDTSLYTGNSDLL